MTASAACEADVFNSEAASEARSVIKVPAQRPFLPSGSPMLSVSSPGKEGAPHKLRDYILNFY